MRTLLIGALSLACVGRSVGEEGSSSQESPTEDEDVEPRPDDGMYAACSASSECAPLDFCVFPADENGYCTDLCDAVDDPSSCDPSPGGSATPSCLDIGLPSMSSVCTLDCRGGASCPGGMRCEAIDTLDGERRVCF